MSETAKVEHPRVPRRVVLLVGGDDSAVEAVLKEYGPREAGATRIHADVATFARERPGRTVAAEWMGALGWKRYLYVTGPG